MKMEDRETVELKLVKSGFITRWPCHVCGGCTEKVDVLCEGVDESGNEIRICETCLEAREQIDVKLEKHAEYLNGQAAWLRSLIGRINAPSRAEWEAAMEAYNVAAEAYYAAVEAGHREPEFGNLDAFFKKMALNNPKVA
jgi:hypothetical protein